MPKETTTVTTAKTRRVKGTTGPKRDKTKNSAGVFHATVGTAAKEWVYREAKKKGLSGNEMIRLLIENAKKKKLLS